MVWFSNKNRPFEYGPYPMERLKRDASIIDQESQMPSVARKIGPTLENNHLAQAIAKYHQLYRESGFLENLPSLAPVPDDLYRRAVDIKGAGYFLDVANIGICKIPKNGWLSDDEKPKHTHAIVIVQAHGRVPEKENLAHEWCDGLAAQAAEFRAFEVSVAISEHIKHMGFGAEAHDRDTGGVDLERLAVLAGVCIRDKKNIINPFLGQNYSLAVVTTEYGLEIDLPLDKSGLKARGLGFWLGVGGAVPGIEWNRRLKRRSDLGVFPMEQVKRVEKPTTLIFDEEVPRVPKRANFFMRARAGDLGEKAKREVARFAFKHPFAQSMVSLIRAMVPHQDGDVAENKNKYLRALSFQLYESNGVLKRTNVNEVVKAISKEDRKQFRKIGIKIGRYHIFLPKMLKPKAVALRIMLWKFYNNIGENSEIPKSGLNFLSDYQNKFDKKFLLLCGFENFGNYYIRVDILEKLFLKILDNTKNGKFKITSEMMNLLGCSKENFFKVMRLMDYKREKKDEDIFFYRGSKKINKVKFFKSKNSPFQKLSSLNLK